MRVGIMGAPGSGKTTAALTFPKPIVLSYDSKEPEGTTIVPFFDKEFETSLTRDMPNNYKGVRGALLKWLRTEARRAESGTTFILDSWTHLFNALDIWHEAMAPVLFMTKSREIDAYAAHRDRLLFAQEIFREIKSLPYTFVITFHEQIDRDSDGRPTGFLKPLMKGQFADQAASHLSIFVRQVIIQGPRYVWDVGASPIFHSILPVNFKRVELIENRYIPASYQELVKRL